MIFLNVHVTRRDPHFLARDCEISSVISHPCRYVLPLFLLRFAMIRFVFILEQTPWSERKSLLKVIWTVVISPFGTVRFLEGYVGDILTRYSFCLLYLFTCFLCPPSILEYVCM